MKIRRNILLNPGPATTTDTVKFSQVVPDICPREKEFIDVMAEVRSGLIKIVKGSEEYTCILFAGSGTAAMDAVINSVVYPDKKILVINNGAYGERMAGIAKAYNIGLVELNFPLDRKIDIRIIEENINKDQLISHIAVVHHETTTGMMNPLEEIAKIAASTGKKLIVDAISSFAGIPIDLNKINVDYLISSSNKCLQGMAGISFVICKEKDVKHTSSLAPRSFYLNLYRQHKYFEEHGEMQFTPPVQVVYALRQAIREYFEEGTEKRYNRYSENWVALTEGLERLGFELFLDKNLHSRLLTTVIEPEDDFYDFNVMHDLLLHMGFTIYPGKVGNIKTFRIANIGAINKDDVKKFLEVFKDVLAKMKKNKRQ